MHVALEGNPGIWLIVVKDNELFPVLRIGRHRSKEAINVFSTLALYESVAVMFVDFRT